VNTNQRPVADAVAGISYECLLCGGHAHAYSADGGQTVDVWDLCRTCNAAFHFLAVGLELLAATAPAAVDQLAGQLELEADVAPRYNSSGRRLS
jgi:hypothetical protein